MNAARKRIPKIEDWHPADVVAALKKKGSSLAALERENRYSSGALSMLWSMFWPKAQTVVAAKIGVDPWVIWPTRYTKDHAPKTGRITRIVRRGQGCNA